MSSLYMLLPPSMMMSPRLIRPPSVCTVSSVILPDGSITQTIFGEWSWPTMSSRPVDLTAPSPTMPSTAFSLWS
jgi:hypothetical protein